LVNDKLIPVIIMPDLFTLFKRKYIPVFLLALFSQVIVLKVHAQFRQKYEPYNINQDIDGMCFLNPSTGFVAFSTGAVGFTQDSGASYTMQYIGYANTNFNGYNVNLTFGFRVTGVWAFSTDSLFAYGDYGTEPSILFSADQGQSWKVVFHRPINIGTTIANAGVTDLKFPGNSNIGFAIHNEQVIGTLDRGQTWSAVINVPNGQMQRLSFPTAFAGYAIGYNKCYKTVNGGASWSLVNLPNGAGSVDYNNISFVSADTGFISESYSGIIYKTIDGGNTWTAMNDPSIESVGGTDMYFTNDSTGYIALQYGYQVVKTTNSGKVWEFCKRTETTQYLSYGLNHLFFYNNQIGWAGGDGDYLMITTNGGTPTLPAVYFKIDTSGLFLTGTVNLVNYSQTTYQYKWFKNDTLISTAYNCSYTHNIYNSQDNIKLVVFNGTDADTGFQTIYFTLPPPPPPPVTGWVVEPTNINDNLQDVRFFGTNGMVVGVNGLYYTTTGAENASGWSKYTITTSSSDSSLLTRVRFRQLAFDDQGPVFFAVGNDTVNNIPVILKIDLSNLSYSFVYKGAAGKVLNSITFYSNGPSYMYDVTAVGNNGLVVDYNMPNNATSTWTEPDHANLTEVFNRTFPGDVTQKMGALSASALYIGNFTSYNGYTLKSVYPLSIANPIAAVNEYEPFDFIINRKTLYHSLDDGGSNSVDSITSIMSPNVGYNCLARQDPYHGAYIGTDSGVYEVNYYGSISPLNGKESVEYQPTSQHKQINYIWFKQRGTDYDTGYAVGNGGVLLKTLNAGGPTIPYTHISTVSAGGCAGATISLSGLNGSGTSCNWYVDNKFITSNCGASSTTISTPGLHTLKYVVSNSSGLSDSVLQKIVVGVAPAVNLPVTISDSILCKAGTELVNIANTQANCRYTLINGSNSSFGYGNSNGGQIYFTSLPITTAGNYYIKVSDTTSGCSLTFTNPISIAIKLTDYWTGVVSSAWEDPSNWSCGIVPDANTDVVIDSAIPISPVLNSNTSCKSLTLNSGAKLIINPGFNLTITH
jgi:photosystem II stability/assembly factor-like uncharacterized protein